LSAIRETKKFEDDTEKGLIDAIDGFKEQFLAGGKDSVPVGREAEAGALPEDAVEQVQIVKHKR